MPSTAGEIVVRGVIHSTLHIPTLSKAHHVIGRPCLTAKKYLCGEDDSFRVVISPTAEQQGVIWTPVQNSYAIPLPFQCMSFGGVLTLYQEKKA